MNKGFTLIELLIVIAIIALLMAIAVPSYTRFVSQGRDAKRQSDLKIIQSALEQYRADVGSYPPSLSFGSLLTNPNETTKIYIKKLPDDPLVNSEQPRYMYEGVPTGCNTTSIKCVSYCLYSRLEDTSLVDVTSSCRDDPQYNYEVTPVQ